jgi:hypothetical protein
MGVGRAAADLYIFSAGGLNPVPVKELTSTGNPLPRLLRQRRHHSHGGMAAGRKTQRGRISDL